MRTNTFNDNHPELRGGEVFVTNTANQSASNIGWKTKRVGCKAYNVNGEEVAGLYPVFKCINEKINNSC